MEPVDENLIKHSKNQNISKEDIARFKMQLDHLNK